MGKNKLERFAEIAEFSNVLELTDFKSNCYKPATKWHTEIFGNENPITLELACGKGKYTLELAERNPGRNYVGVDIKGARLWKGAKSALEQDITNVRFLRIYIDHLTEYFGKDEVNEIWITFPDPYPKYSDRNKRLTASKFLELYREVLEQDGAVHFKTDSDNLFEYTLKVFRQEKVEIVDLTRDVHGERPEDSLLTIKTFYERRHLSEGKTIKYLKARL